MEIAVDLTRQGSAGLRALDLRPLRGTARRIRGVEIDPIDGGVHLRLTVPDDQPGGTYHAVILDTATDAAVGTLTVRIPV